MEPTKKSVTLATHRLRRSCAQPGQNLLGSRADPGWLIIKGSLQSHYRLLCSLGLSPVGVNHVERKFGRLANGSFFVSQGDDQSFDCTWVPVVAQRFGCSQADVAIGIAEPHLKRFCDLAAVK